MTRFILIAALVAACNDSADDTKQIDVAQYNTFGITRMTARHYSNTDSNLFELRAYTQENSEVALVRLRIGPVSGVVAGEAVDGAEVLVSVLAAQVTQKSLEQWTIVIDADRAPDPGIKTFLFLSFVRDALKQEAGIVVQGTPQEATNAAFDVSSCPTSWLLTSPVAAQCCSRGYDPEPPEGSPLEWRDLWPAPTLTASQNSSTAYYAMDGGSFTPNLSTRWTTGVPQANGQYIQIASSTCTYVNSITLNQSGAPTDYPRGYAVYLSLDGTSWGTAVATGVGTNGTNTIINFSPKAAKYIKIVQTGSSGSWWSIYDMHINYTERCNELPRTDPNNHIAWTATGYMGSGSQVPSAYAGSYAIDGSASTRFNSGETQRPGERLELNFGFCESVDRVVMDAGAYTCDYARGYEIYFSMDGINWGSPVKVGTGTAAPLDTGLFTRTNGKYMKIVQTQTTSPCWWSVTELHVYGHPCYENPGVGVPPSTNFVRSTDGALTKRSRNFGGQTCLGYYDEPCLGAACYFGPNGFSRPYIQNAEQAWTTDYVAYYRVDEIAGTSVWDSSRDWNPTAPNPSPLTLANGAAFVAGGHLTSAIQFDGIDDYAVNTAPDSSVHPTTAYALAAWVKLTQTDEGGGEVVSLGDNVGLRVDSDGNVRTWFSSAPGEWTQALTTDVNVLDGGWHLLVGTYNGASIQVWIDGVLKQSTAASGTVQYVNGTGLYVGTHGNGAPWFDYNGLIDEVRVYTHGLTSSDIATLFGSTRYYYQVGYHCATTLQYTPQTAMWTDVTGTAPRGQGCPSGSGRSPLGFWDY